jgi:hypothetical protein
MQGETGGGAHACRHGAQDAVRVLGAGRRRGPHAVEEQGGGVDGGEPVDHAVMGLGRDRPAPAREAVEQDGLPQRLAPV